MTLANEIAEDAAATKVIRGLGLNVHLVQGSFEQPLGPRRWRQVWGRQLRWARMRRATFVAFFMPELLAGSLFSLLAGLYGTSALGLNITAVLFLLFALWFGSEALLARGERPHDSAPA